MPHSYIAVEDIKTGAAFSATSTAIDAALRTLAEGISFAIDQHTRRTFQPRIETRYFSGDGGTLLDIGDIISIGTLSEDQSDAGTWDVAWGTGDYLKLPLNAQPTRDYGRPYEFLQVNPASNGTQD